MKKVVFLAKYFVPYVGGVETHVMMLSRELQKRGYQITVITNQHETHLKLQEKIESLDVLRIPKSAFDKKIPTWVWILQHIKVFLQAYVVHAHDVFWWILPLRFLLFWKKFYITFHGYEGSEKPTPKQIRAHQLWNFLSSGSLVIGDFHDKWYQTKSDQISYGAISLNHSIKMKPKKDTAIYIGRLSEDVGIMQYLEALWLLKTQGKNLSLDVYGDGPQRVEAEKYVKDHKLQVHFFGFVKNAEQKLGHYSIAFVSRYLAILEALSKQIPIIAHANNDIKYDYLALAPFASWIKIARNSSEIASSVLQYKKVSKNTEQWAKQQTWQKLADQYEKMWKVH